MALKKTVTKASVNAVPVEVVIRKIYEISVYSVTSEI